MITATAQHLDKTGSGLQVMTELPPGGQRAEQQLGQPCSDKTAETEAAAPGTQSTAC